MAHTATIDSNDPDEIRAVRQLLDPSNDEISVSKLDVEIESDELISIPEITDDNNDTVAGSVTLEDFEETEQEDLDFSDYPFHPEHKQFRPAAILFVVDGPLTSNQVANLTHGTDWEMPKDLTSAHLSNLRKKGVVKYVDVDDDRDLPGTQPYYYTLTDEGAQAVADVLPVSDPPEFLLV